MNSLSFGSVHWIRVAHCYVMWGSIVQSAKDEDRTEKKNITHSLLWLGYPFSSDFAYQCLGYSGLQTLHLPHVAPSYFLRNLASNSESECQLLQAFRPSSLTKPFPCFPDSPACKSHNSSASMFTASLSNNPLTSILLCVYLLGCFLFWRT